MAFGIGKALKKGAKKVLGDYHTLVTPSWEAAISGVAGALSGAATGAMAGGVGAIPGAIIGGVAGVLQGAHQKTQINRQEEAQERELRQMQDIANQQAMAAAVPIATSAAQQMMTSAETVDSNYATERRRALSTAGTLTSSRLQRWAGKGKRRTL